MLLMMDRKIEHFKINIYF